MRQFIAHNRKCNLIGVHGSHMRRGQYVKQGGALTPGVLMPIAGWTGLEGCGLLNDFDLTMGNDGADLIGYSTESAVLVTANGEPVVHNTETVVHN